MASSSNSENTPPDVSASDITSLLSTMKKQNEEILANERDNSSSQKHSDTESRKRNQSEDEIEKYQNEQSIFSNKKARVSVADLPEPPVSFNTLDDDCLGNVLDFVGKKSYSAFGRVNKRCHEMFCSKELPKVTYLFGYGPLHMILQRGGRYRPIEIAKGVLHHNRRDIFEWTFTDESVGGSCRLKFLSYQAIEESRLDILREVFQRANEWQLEYLRYCDDVIDLCVKAAIYGKLECLKFLRENECGWDEQTWYVAKSKGHEHILGYLRNSGYPKYWQK